jgi:hypothetical protein
VAYYIAGSVTLIITCVQPEHVVQVSDGRLTDPNSGSMVDEHAIKAMFVECADARFGIAFTGVAKIGSDATTPWLAEKAMPQLGGVNQLRLRDFAERLRAILERRLRLVHQRNRGRGASKVGPWCQGQVARVESARSRARPVLCQCRHLS